MNLLSLINMSLEVVYCSTILSNHCIIRFIRFVSRFHSGLWNGFCQLSTFRISNQQSNVQSYCSARKILKKKLKTKWGLRLLALLDYHHVQIAQDPQGPDDTTYTIHSSPHFLSKLLLSRKNVLQQFSNISHFPNNEIDLF